MRPGARVADVGRERHRRLAHPVAQRRGRAPGAGFLDQLLVAALDRAVALAQVDHLAVRVAHDLDLDVARVLRGTSRRRPRRCRRRRAPRSAPGRTSAANSSGVVRDAHSLAAAAGRGLDDDRETDLLARTPAPRRSPRSVPGEPGTVGTPASCGQAPRGGLVAHQPDLLGGRADEGDVATPGRYRRTRRSRRGSRSRDGSRRRR